MKSLLISFRNINPPKSREKFAMTAIDQLSRFVLASSLPSKTMDSVSNAFQKSVVSIFGPAKLIISDKGSEFKHRTLKKMAEMSWIQKQ